jgi:hypothetical protein
MNKPFHRSSQNNFYPSQTGNQEMTYVHATTYFKARSNWAITQAQIDHATSKHKQPWTGLTVSTATAKKLEILAAGNLEHYKTLFKVIDARY